MLNTIRKKAIEKRKDVQGIFQSVDYKNIIQKAKETWIDFEPKKKPCEIIGIDSSFVPEKYQGITCFAVAVNASNQKGEIIFEDGDVGVLTENETLEDKAGALEMYAVEKAIGKANFILVDGSVLSHHYRGTGKEEDRIVSILKENPNILFVSKNSNTRIQFNGFLGDMTYFNHISKKTGMTKIFKTTTSRNMRKAYPVSYVYARLSEATPLLKIEKFGEDISEEEFRNNLDHISHFSVHGYPNALNQAHYNCKIYRKNMAEIVSILGLRNQIGAREALGE